ncbi:MAG: hypothetical protein IKN11_00915 [Bacteroidales bacterium]|nr:hypothetical protein [Bacteroidales bacterium]
MKKIILILLIFNFQFSILNSLWAQEIGMEYDEHGRVVSSSHGVVDANDRLAVLITYTYDSIGVVETRTLQSYDKQGRAVRKEVYTVDEYLLYTEENQYDRHGNRTRCVQTTYDEDGKPSPTIYKYRYSKQPDGTWQLVSILLNGKEVLLEE